MELHPLHVALLLMNISKQIKISTNEIVWICLYCPEKGTTDDIQTLILFNSYMDDIVYTVKGNAISLHKNVQFTLETLNEK